MKDINITIQLLNINQELFMIKRKIKKRHNKFTKTNTFYGYLFIDPQIIGLTVFILFPILMSFYLTLTKWNFIKSPEFVGLRNFYFVLTDQVFMKTISNTLIFVISIVPLTVIVSLGLALLTNKKIRGLNVYKGIFFLPNISTTVAIALTWYWLFAANFGLINQFLLMIGIEGPGWPTRQLIGLRICRDQLSRSNHPWRPIIL